MDIKKIDGRKMRLANACACTAKRPV